MGVEKKTEKQCCNVAKANGWWTRKFASPSNRGVPDRMFIKDGRVVFIEFKAPGNEPTNLQDHTMGEMREHGAEVYWTDNVADFKKYLKIPT